MLLLELAVAITAYSLRSQVGDVLDAKLRATLPYYYKSYEVQGAFDFIQSRVRKPLRFFLSSRWIIEFHL